MVILDWTHVTNCWCRIYTWRMFLGILKEINNHIIYKLSNGAVTLCRVAWTAPLRLLESNTAKNQPKISPAELFFYLSPGPYRSIPDLYQVLPGLVPSSPSSYSSSLSFSPCPRRVHTTSSEICNAARKYVLPLWNMYCRFEICIATPKYVIQAACTRSQTITNGLSE